MHFMNSSTGNSALSAVPQIALINEGGLVVGRKPKQLLNKSDVYQVIFILLITRSRYIVLSSIAGGRLSATAVTLRYATESAEDAAFRAVRQVTDSTGAQPHHLGDQFYTAPDGRKIYMSIFYDVVDAAEPNTTCQLLTSSELDDRLESCTPALAFAWRTYKGMLPV
jgi:hypothetical protein